MANRIYTRTGDKGETSLIGGTRLPKHHVRIEAYGTVDELNAHIGLLRDVIDDPETVTLLLQVQDRLFTIGSQLAADPVKNKMELPSIAADDASKLEAAIDRMDNVVPPMRSFVLPGGHMHVSFCHIARTVCRRAERAVLRLNDTAPVANENIVYLNRLSDYLFMLARWMVHRLGAEEKPWRGK